MFGGGLPCERAQLLAIKAGVRKLDQEITDGGISLGNQSIPPAFDPVQASGFPAARIGIGVNGRPHLGKGVLVATQLLGEKLDLALARDVRVNRQGDFDLTQDGIPERELLASGGRQLQQALGQYQHVEGITPQLTAAGRKPEGTGATLCARLIRQGLIRPFGLRRIL